MFVTVKFQSGDSRLYTYRYDGEREEGYIAIEPGEYAVVETKDGTKAVEVVEVNVPEPAFECRNIIMVLVPKKPEFEVLF